jgi:hypothetical protein
MMQASVARDLLSPHSGRTAIEILISEEQVADLVAHVFNKPFDIETLLQKIRFSIRGL